MEENKFNGEKIDARELLFEMSVAIGDVFEAEVRHEDDALLFLFGNGQKFRLTVTEVE